MGGGSSPDPPEGDGPPQPKPLVPGVASALSPMVRRILGPNPGAMTGPGTNTYLIGIDEVAVIDPGIDDAAHLDAILGCGGDRIRWILCTHTHPDHAPGAAALQAATGAAVLAFESRDGLEVDEAIGDRHVVVATEFRLTAVHTPGHASNHLCFYLRQEATLFSGDHIMQGSTVVIGPPDGDMTAYLASLDKVRALRLKAIAPGHGHLIEDPYGAIDDYVAHRHQRERQVLDALAAGDTAVASIVDRLYVGLVDELVPRARQSVHAHLRKLAAEGRVTSSDADDESSAWAAA